MIEKHTRFFLLSVLIGFFSLPLLSAELRVVASYPYIREVVKAVGADRVTVDALSKGQWDPHVVVPKPSLISLVRRADLLIINGAQLEIGWIPPLLQQANNPGVLPSKKGFLDLSDHFDLIQKPDSISRAEGDIHPAGNPHFHLNPVNILKMARLVSSKLIELDPAGKDHYNQKLTLFLAEWQKNLDRWSELMAPLKGSKVIEYHRNLDYFLNQFGIEVIATVELLPGIPPTTRHMIDLIDIIKQKQVSLILHDVYHNEKSSRYLARETGLSMVVIPHDIEATPEVVSLTSLYDTIVNRLVKR
jgi:zinc/manganese transport system substrate-binding protein